MEYSYLGKSGLKVSRLCLGTMNFGPETEEKDAFKIMDAALDAGINFFDTANVYTMTVKVGQRKLSDVGSSRAAEDARRSCWQRRYTEI